MRNNPLRQHAFTLLIVIGTLLVCLGYGALLLDWVQAYRTGMYIHQPVEAVYETAAQVLYLYVGVRFLKNRIRFF